MKEATRTATLLATAVMVCLHPGVSAALQDAPSPAVRAGIAQMSLGEPNDVNPVVIGTVAVRDGPGKEESAFITLIVRLRIANGWHVYAQVPEGDSMQPTQIDVEPPAGARWTGEWQTPERYQGTAVGTTEYRDDAVFTRQMYVAGVASDGRVYRDDSKPILSGNVRYQACTEEKCLPPTSALFEVPPLLATGDVPEGGR